MKENTILSGNCKFLDQRAREKSGEKVKKEKKKKSLVARTIFIPGGLGGSNGAAGAERNKDGLAEGFRNGTTQYVLLTG